MTGLTSQPPHPTAARTPSRAHATAARRVLVVAVAAWAVLGGLVGARAQGAPPSTDPASTVPRTDRAQGGSYEARFDTAWRLVADRYWDLPRTGIDWDAVGERYRPEAVAAADDAAFYSVLQRMYDELGDDHSVFVPPARVEEIRRTYGDLPCVAVFGAAPSAPVPTGALGAASLPFWGRAQVEELGALANVHYGRTADGVGYLRLPDLASDGAAEAVRTAVTRLEGDGAHALVLDLRGNPGGRLVTMMQVAGVFTRGWLWRAITGWTLPMPYPAVGTVATSLPLVVLVDGGVNSAAEGLAGALQAVGRATVVGETSAGNVEAVLPFCLRDGSQAWIATGVLAPLRGPTWEGRGVVPDVEAPADQALEAALAFLREAAP